MTKKLGVFVKNAKRDPVVQSLKRIKERYVPHGKLIADSNQLMSNAIGAISKHNNANKPFQLRSNDVNTYIAASSISHILDGWGYLSQAVNAHVNGNKGAAIHMAYYAELRAVMSLLASEGIGVFSNEHIGIKSETEFSLFLQHKRREWSSANGQYVTKQNKLGTHVFAWEAFEKWCRSDLKPSYDLLRLFRVKGVTFSDLLPGFHPQATQLVSSNIAKSWLKKWAFDVKKYKNDRELRNFVSYRPQSLSGFNNNQDFKQVILDTYKLLQVLSPSINDPFDYLDKLLLKALFEELYTLPNIRSRGLLADLISDSFNSVGATFDVVTRNILLSGNSIDQSHLIFSEASKNVVEPLPVISRAALLLRVSTGASSVLMNDAGVNKADLNFIWDNYGFNHGFWEIAKPVSDYYELWSEIETEFSDFGDQTSHLNNSSFVVRDELNEDFNKLSQFNRACLWGI